MLEYKRIGWWLWLSMAVLLSAGHSGRDEAFLLAIVLGSLQTGLFLVRETRLAAFPVQVRTAYLVLLVAAQWTPLHFIYWIQFAGTWAYVLFGYCPLARMMSLLPGNRTEPLTMSLLKTAIFAPPVRGSLIKAAVSEPA